MDITYRNLNEYDKKMICGWKYEGKYSIYNLKSYEEQKELKRGFCNPEIERNYYGFFDRENLIGFINLFEEENEVFLGIGVNPKCLNRGYGKKIIDITCDISKKLYPNKIIYLGVRSWNKRAINCYKSQGFKIDGESFKLTTLIGEGEFYRMIRE